HEAKSQSEQADDEPNQQQAAARNAAEEADAIQVGEDQVRLTAASMLGRGQRNAWAHQRRRERGEQKGETERYGPDARDQEAALHAVMISREIRLPPPFAGRHTPGTRRNTGGSPNEKRAGHLSMAGPS